eukprot:TRINITY_DN12620_c0_g1_i1.p1 TRINITY_DN12620_c0_g1~~TRINITY_DN12620_c0_g1_i1.p1  ORF type:complete len:236 (+),score=28.39 TRINITY_DN12620_c0_g1_i1:36-743(+)
MDKSLDEIIADDRPVAHQHSQPPIERFGKGSKGFGGKGWKGGLPPTVRPEPYRSGKGGKKGTYRGARAEPDINERWVKDKFDDGTRGKRFMKPLKPAEHFDINARVHIKGIPWNWEEKELKHVLEQAAPVHKLVFYYDTIGRPNGTAMATFYNQHEASKAIEVLDGCKLSSSVISLSAAKSSTLPDQNRRVLTPSFGRPVSVYRPPKPVEAAPQTETEKMNDELQAFVAGSEKGE